MQNNSEPRLKVLLRKLDDIVYEIKSEVYSDPSKYLKGPNIKIGDDNDGEY